MLLLICVLNITAVLFVTSILVQSITSMSVSVLCIRHLPNLTLPCHVSVQSQSCPTLCNPMDYSTPGFPVRHQLLELAQTHAIESVIAMFMLSISVARMKKGVNLTVILKYYICH